MSEDQYRHLDEVDGSLRAAATIVPLVLELTGPVSSVVDVGGGTGGWLREFGKAGVARLALIDSAAVEPHLLIPRECFHAADLERPLPELGRFDLATSLECAEHLSEQRSRSLVQWLTSTADVVLFRPRSPDNRARVISTNSRPATGRRCFAAVASFAAIFFDSAFSAIKRSRTGIARICSSTSSRGRSLADSSPDFLPEDFVLLHRDVETTYAQAWPAKGASRFGAGGLSRRFVVGCGGCRSVNE